MSLNSSLFLFVLTLLFACGLKCEEAAAQTADGRADLRIEKLELDRTKIMLPCRPGFRPKPGECDDNFAVTAKVIIVGKNAGRSTLVPTVSGGRIISRRQNEFTWNLAGVMPGAYVLTVDAAGEDGKLTGSKSVTLRVAECRSCSTADHCPNISVTGPAEPVSAGDTIKFAAAISGAAEGATTYNWAVSSGAIARGQGTPQIEVETNGEMAGTTVTATVVLSNPGWLMACSLSASETAAVGLAPQPAARLTDELRTRGGNCEEGFARMDAFFAELNSNPSDAGVVIVYDDADQPGAALRRKKQLTNFIRMRKFEPGRITVLDGTVMKAAVTEFWLIPPGALPPEVRPGPGIAPIVTSRKASGPYFFAGEYSDGIPGCDGNIYDLVEFANTLKAEIGSRGRVIIRESSLANYRKKRHEIESELKSNGIPASRIIFIYKRVRPMRLQESIELWIVPIAAVGKRHQSIRSRSGHGRSHRKASRSLMLAAPVCP